jgi:dihydrofolate reductase
MIAIVVAASENNAIGLNNQLLWHLPNDLRFFKNTTWGGAVIMGRKTFDSVNKPLPGRTNIVVTTNKAWKADQVEVAGSIEDAIQIAQSLHHKDVFIIGGGAIYRQSMHLADRIYLTKVHADFEADVFFDQPDFSAWTLVSSAKHEPDDKHAFAYTFEIWDRNSTNH